MDSVFRVGLAGLGTVGSGVARLLARHGRDLGLKSGRPIRVAGVAARDRARSRGFALDGIRWHDSPVELAQSDEVDVVVELIGGADGAALACVEAALEAGKPVVTANKALLARHGARLAERAEAAGLGLRFEAAVAGGIPIVKTLKEALAGNQVARVYGILNGTCNYILTRMERERLAFEACLAEAQRLGYAEADPTFDIEGFDTAHKLSILTSLAFGTRVDAEQIYIEGISSITPEDLEAADELGYRIKLLGVAQRTETGIEQRVHPTMVPKSHAIAAIDGVLNAVAVDGDFVGELLLVGPGAGGEATASAVVGDIADLARGASGPVFGVPAASLAPYVQGEMRAHEGGYYTRLAVHDRPGAFAAIARRMAEQGISLESIVQKRRGSINRLGPILVDEGPQLVVLITHETTEAAIRAALALIEADGHIVGRPQMIRIEKP